MNAECIEAQADMDCEALMSPMPTAIARSLRDDPAYCKCPRCWHFHTVKENHDELCDRCCRVLIDEWPRHESVPKIKASLEAQRRKYEARQ